MFSNFSSFLPSALHLNSNNELPRPDVTAADAQTEDEDDQRSLPPERAEYPAQPSRGKDRDGKGASEVGHLPTLSSGRQSGRIHGLRWVFGILGSPP